MKICRRHGGPQNKASMKVAGTLWNIIFGCRVPVCFLCLVSGLPWRRPDHPLCVIVLFLEEWGRCPQVLSRWRHWYALYLLGSSELEGEATHARWRQPCYCHLLSCGWWKARPMTELQVGGSVDQLFIWCQQQWATLSGSVLVLLTHCQFEDLARHSIVDKKPTCICVHDCALQCSQLSRSAGW